MQNMQLSERGFNTPQHSSTTAYSLVAVKIPCLKFSSAQLSELLCEDSPDQVNNLQPILF